MRLCEFDAPEKVKFEVDRTGNGQFVVGMYSNGKDIGTFGYALVGDEAKNIAEVSPLQKNKGYGKLLLLKAIYTANTLNIPFYEDTQEVSIEQSRVYDSLFDSFYIMQPEHEDQWYVTEEGYDYLKANTE